MIYHECFLIVKFKFCFAIGVENNECNFCMHVEHLIKPTTREPADSVEEIRRCHDDS